MISSLITNQRDASVREIPLGQGTVAGMGCEAIALYNILVYYGGQPDFPSLVNEVTEEKLLWRNGTWGMAPHQMKKYLLTRGFDAKFISEKDFAKITPEILWKRHEAVIVTCFNRDFLHNGVHSFAVIPSLMNEGSNHRQNFLSPNGYVSNGDTVSEILAGRKLFTAIQITRKPFEDKLC